MCLVRVTSTGCSLEESLPAASGKHHSSTAAMCGAQSVECATQGASRSWASACWHLPTVDPVWPASCAVSRSPPSPSCSASSTGLQARRTPPPPPPHPRLLAPAFRRTCTAPMWDRCAPGYGCSEEVGNLVDIAHYTYSQHKRIGLGAGGLGPVYSRRAAPWLHTDGGAL